MVKPKAKASPKSKCQGKNAEEGRNLSASSLAHQKIREILRELDEYCTEIKVNAKTGLTCHEQIVKDVERDRSGKQVHWGKILQGPAIIVW